MANLLLSDTDAAALLWAIENTVEDQAEWFEEHRPSEYGRVAAPCDGDPFKAGAHRDHAAREGVARLEARRGTGGAGWRAGGGNPREVRAGIDGRRKRKGETSLWRSLEQ